MGTYEAFDVPLSEANDVEDDLAEEVFRLDDAAGGLAAFAERRSPVFPDLPVPAKFE